METRAPGISPTGSGRAPWPQQSLLATTDVVPAISSHVPLATDQARTRDQPSRGRGRDLYSHFLPLPPWSVVVPVVAEADPEPLIASGAILSVTGGPRLGDPVKGVRMGPDRLAASSLTDQRELLPLLRPTTSGALPCDLILLRSHPPRLVPPARRRPHPP
jgi:hypothetical protein